MLVNHLFNDINHIIYSKSFTDTLLEIIYIYIKENILIKMYKIYHKCYN